MQSSNNNSESNNDIKENEHIEDNQGEEKKDQEEGAGDEDKDKDEDEDEDENKDEDEEDWEDNEDINQDGFIPEFPNFGLDFFPTLSTNPAHGIYMQMGNSHILSNLNNLHGLFEIMMSSMIPINNVPSVTSNVPSVTSNVPGVTSNVPGVTSNVPDATLNIITEINPSNSSNSVLANTTLNGQHVIHPVIHPMSNAVTEQMVVTQQMVEEEVGKLISSGMDNLHLVSEPVLNFIEHCYLENMQYDDDIINLIRYTIKYCFAQRTEFEAKELISGILYYSFSGNNSLFSDNYDDIVLPMLTNELKRIVTQSIRLSILQRAFAAPQMEDVKLVVNPDVLEKIPKSKYIELNDKIKSMNVSCTVCQDEFNEEDMVRILPCEHIYHPDCIDDWLTAHSYKCPCCRKPAGEYSAKI